MERAMAVAPSVSLGYQDNPRRSHKLRFRFHQRLNLKENILFGSFPVATRFLRHMEHI